MYLSLSQRTLSCVQQYIQYMVRTNTALGLKFYKKFRALFFFLPADDCEIVKKIVKSM